MSEPEPFTPSVLMLAMDQLASCVCTEIAKSAAGPVCWCGVWPGEEVSWEFCGDCGNDACGMAWVRLNGIFPYDTFPAPVVDLGCRRPLAYNIEVGALRCMPVSDNEGELPSSEQITMTSMETYADLAALYRALLCCDFEAIAVEAWVPVGPQGGCVGGVWGAYFALE